MASWSPTSLIEVAVMQLMRGLELIMEGVQEEGGCRKHNYAGDGHDCNGWHGPDIRQSIETHTRSGQTGGNNQ